MNFLVTPIPSSRCEGSRNPLFECRPYTNQKTWLTVLWKWSTLASNRSKHYNPLVWPKSYNSSETFLLCKLVILGLIWKIHEWDFFFQSREAQTQIVIVDFFVVPWWQLPFSRILWHLLSHLSCYHQSLNWQALYIPAYWCKEEKKIHKYIFNRFVNSYFCWQLFFAATGWCKLSWSQY